MPDTLMQKNVTYDCDIFELHLETKLDIVSDNFCGGQERDVGQASPWFHYLSAV